MNSIRVGRKRIGYRAALIAWCLSISCFCASAIAQTQSLRVVTYNIDADINGVTEPQFGVFESLEGIGEEQVNGRVQPLDILALQETTSDLITVDPIVSALNDFYAGAAVYAHSDVQGLQNGSNAFGNGPNSIVYNTKKLQLVDTQGVGFPLGSLNGMYRQVMRYQFQPIGGTAANTFYVYVTHMKSSFSGSLFTNESLRNGEAQIIRQDADSLQTPENPHPSILYLGDFNLDGSAPITNFSGAVSAYQTLTAPGPCRAVDPLNTNPQRNDLTWANNAAYASILTESGRGIQYRDDLELMTQNVFDGTAESGLKYVPGSLHTFGNNGSVGLGGLVTDPTNTAFNNIDLDAPISPDVLPIYLYYASDHLPVVADFTIAVPEPATVWLLAIGMVMLFASRSPHRENWPS